MDGDHSPTCFLSLVIPAYNEAAGIAHAIDEADAALASLGHTYEILIIDDGSSDDTAAIVDEIAKQRPTVRLLRHDGNQGYGAALRTGFAAARGDRVAFTDADCQFFLADLASLIALTDQHPIAVGYRVGRQDSRLRKFYSRGYNLLVRTLVGATVRDIDCALKVFRREALAKILPASRGFFVNTEMLARARQQRLSVAEVGVRHRPRLRGRSKVSLLDIPRTLNALLPFWWANVLFQRREPSVQPGRGGGFLHAAILAVMAGLLFFGRLGAPLLEPEEARYAEIPRQMLAEGSWVTPVLHGEPYYHKPALLYWLVMGCYALFGVHDWAARLVPSMAGVLIVLVTYAWASRAVGRWAAFASAAMLCLSAKFIYQAGMLTFDAPLCLFVLTALACVHRALEGAKLKLGWWLLGAIAGGLGVLTKGPVALALIVPPVAMWQLMERRSARAGWKAWLGWLAAVGLVAGPWFVAIAWRDAAALGEFFWLHNLVRYVAPLDHEKPVWFFLPALVLGMLPWSLLLLPFAGYLLKRSASAGRRRPAALGFFVLAFVWIVMFFSLSGCKRAGYILPAFPFLALMLGTFVANTFVAKTFAWLPARSHPGWSRWAHRATLGALVVGMAVAGAAGARTLLAWPHVVAANLVLLAIFAVVWQRGPSRVAWRGWAACGVAVFALLLVGVHQILPDYHRTFALRGQVRRQFELARDSGMPVVSYPKRWDSVSFYLQRDDVEVYSPARRAELIRDLQQHEQTMLFVKQGEALQDLLRALPADLEFVPRGRPGRNVIGGVVQRRDQLSPER